MGRPILHRNLLRPVLIAECGNNHEGSLETALDLTRAAAASGADLIKFQAGTAESFARSGADIERYRKYELGLEGYRRLVKEGASLGVPVFFSVWHELFRELRHLEFFKLAARQCTQENASRYDWSTTFISIPHNYEKQIRFSQAIPMHCVTEYPASDPMLFMLFQWESFFGRKVGYSDHTIGIDACVEAAGEGACAIEKHFTLDHSFGPLRDHALSATPEEFKRLAVRTGKKI